LRENVNAASMKRYALKDAGERGEELPLAASVSSSTPSVDTAALEDAPAIYFELCAK
jgi:hypothetical protein